MREFSKLWSRWDGYRMFEAVEPSHYRSAYLDEQDRLRGANDLVEFGRLRGCLPRKAAAKYLMPSASPI